MTAEVMIAKILTPGRLVLTTDVTKLVADTLTGSRGFLPNHIDFATPLGIGLIVLTLPDGQERYAAVDGGVLVKKGRELTVASTRVVVADRLEDLPQNVAEWLRQDDETERTSRRAMAQLETRFIKQFLEFVR